MSIGRILFVTGSMILIGTLMLGGVGRPAWAAGEDEDSLYKYLSVFTEVLKLARTVYVEELDLRPLMAGALDGAADALDPFSVFVPKERIAAYEKARQVGRSHSGVLLLRERGVGFVAALDPGSPAAVAGLRRDDVVAELDGLSTRDMPMWQIHEILTRPVGTKVVLEVVRQGEPLEIELELGRFPRARATLDTVDEFSVLRIPLVHEGTQAEVAELLQQVGSRPLLIDLRGTSDRTPELGFEIAALFVEGPLGSLESRSRRLETFNASSADVVYESGELALLIDRGTMGAAEVFAAVLSERERARTVGRRTFGHAGRSKKVRLSTGDLLEVTDAFYAVPAGEEITEAIEPELEIEGRFFRPVDRDDDNDADGRSKRDRAVLEEALRLLREPAERLAA